MIVLLAIGIAAVLLLRKAIKNAMENRRERKGPLIEEEHPERPKPPEPPG